MSATILSEDEVDELLYCARTNDMEGLHAALNTVSQRLQIEDREILQAAVEPDSGNSVLHMAAANGHTGTKTCSLPPSYNPASKQRNQQIYSGSSWTRYKGVLQDQSPMGQPGPVPSTSQFL